MYQINKIEQNFKNVLKNKNICLAVDDVLILDTFRKIQSLKSLGNTSFLDFYSLKNVLESIDKIQSRV